jgi:pre-mRNA-splicing factor SYF1
LTSDELLNTIDGKRGNKIERARDLFDQALEKCPPKMSKPLFLMYAQMEEEHGLARRAMSIYEKATQSVADADKFEVRELRFFLN